MQIKLIWVQWLISQHFQALFTHYKHIMFFIEIIFMLTSPFLNYVQKSILWKCWINKNETGLNKNYKIKNVFYSLFSSVKIVVKYNFTTFCIRFCEVLKYCFYYSNCFETRGSQFLWSELKLYWMKRFLKN